VGSFHKTLSVLALAATCGFGDSTRAPFFVFREQEIKPMTAAGCGMGQGIAYLVFTVFDNGEAEQVKWVVPPCSNAPPALVWTIPPGSKARTSRLSRDDFNQLQLFMYSPDVDTMRGYMNACPGSGNYEVEFHRASGVRTLQVLSLFRSGYPETRAVICRAKQFAGDELADGCPGSAK
jgi:hypothetical protein